MTALLTPRGIDAPSGGLVPYMAQPRKLRTSTIEVKHLYPFAVGRGLPRLGIPIGKVIGERGNASLCCDPLTWFEDLDLITQASAYIVGLKGFGKSSLAKRWLAVYAAWGIVPLVPADTKGEYSELISSLDGDVIPIGGGKYLNLLDLGVAPAAAKRLGEQTSAGQLLMTNARRRRQLALEGHVTVLRGVTPDDLEQDLLAVALRLLDKAFARRRTVPIASDLANVFTVAHDDLKDAAKWRGNIDTYHDAVKHLERNIGSIARGTGISEPFSRHTTQQMRVDTPTSFDLSGIQDSDANMRAAAQLACWAYAFGQVEVSHALSEAGLGSDPRDPYRFIQFASMLDELWNLLRTGRGMAGLVDSLDRLARQRGIIDLKASHAIVETGGLADEADRAIASRFAELAGFIVAFPCPPSQWPELQRVGNWAERELATLSSWATPDSWAGGKKIPGRCLVKLHDRPAIPCQSKLMLSELGHMNTSKMWRQGQ